MRKLVLLLLLPCLLLAEETRSLFFNVVLEAEHLTVIYAQVTSPVAQVYKKMGDAFQETELLVRLDSAVFQGNVGKAEAAVNKFKTELEAKKRLFQDDALSQFELDDTIAQLAGAEADLIFAKKMLQDTEIRAPYAGRVVKVSMKEFELAQTGKELLTLVDDSVLYARFLVPSTHMQCLKVGLPVEIYLKETGKKAIATLTRISPVIDPASSTILAEARIDNSDKGLCAGMTGRVMLKGCFITEKGE